MLMLVSPAKSLDFTTPFSLATPTQPVFLDRSQALIDILKQFDAVELGRLMKISPKLAHLNYQRYANWQRPFTPDNAKPALAAFQGDVYQGMGATDFDNADYEFAQYHVRMLSGLYGVLRPLDLIQPYRLEMGTRLKTGYGVNLYDFWGDAITQALNQALASMTKPAVVNLASNEYFKAVWPKKLKAGVITPIFKDNKNGAYKVISFYAKKARGMMVRHAVKQRLTRVDDLKSFTSGGYRFDAAGSTQTQWLFLRG